MASNKKKSKGQGKGRQKSDSDQMTLEQQQERKKEIEAGISKNVAQDLVGNEHRLQIGKLLSDAKELKLAIPHGEYKAWISNHWAGKLPYTTAISYKRVYEAFQDNPGMVSKLSWELLDMMSRKSFPDAARQLAVNDPGVLDKCKDKNALRDAAKDLEDKKIDEEAFRQQIQLPSGKRTPKAVLDQLQDTAPRVSRLVQRVRKETPSNPDDRKAGMELLLGMRKDLDEAIQALQQQEKASKVGGRNTKLVERKKAA